MNLPAIAVRTYNQFKDNSSYRKLLKYISKKLDKINDPIKRSEYVHRKIDEEIELEFKDPAVERLTKCQIGCSACCHSQVAVTEDEAHALIKHIEKGVNIDWTKLWIQAKAGNNTKDFLKIPYSMRGCVFLDNKGRCSVYESRPSVCRTNYVLSDPKDCRIESGEVKSVQLLNTYGADTWVYGFFSKSKVNGTLPVMIKYVLDNKPSQVQGIRKQFPSLDA
jgi:uncharacterized protein